MRFFCVLAPFVFLVLALARPKTEADTQVPLIQRTISTDTL